MKIVFTGGGTGGHIFPIVAICREIRKIYPDNQIKLFYLGPKEKYAAASLTKEGVKIKRICAGKMRRYFSLWNFLDFLKIPVGISQSFFWLFFHAPDIVFSKGGYGSLPVVLAARILGIPIFLHESDSVPGAASKITARWAVEVFVSFLNKELFPNEKIVYLGNPIREEVLAGKKEEAKEFFGLKGIKPIILVLGGSQGAQKINETILEILPELLTDFEIIHQTGEKNFKSVQIEAEAILENEDLKKFYHPVGFLEEKQYAAALATADLVISRAGAGAIFEIAGAGKPAILVPLDGSAQNHQIKNAYAFKEMGAGEVIEQKNLTSHFLLEKLKHLFSRPDILATMSKNSKLFAKPRAAYIIASYLVEYLKVMVK